MLKQSLLRLLTLPLRHNNNGKKNSQISTAPYGNNFTGAGAAKYYYFVTSYRLMHSRGRFSAGRRIYFVGRGDFSHGAAVFLTSHHPPAGDFPSPPATIGGGRDFVLTGRPPGHSHSGKSPSRNHHRGHLAPYLINTISREADVRDDIEWAEQSRTAERNKIDGKTAYNFDTT